jgi:hypothetical protein
MCVLRPAGDLSICNGSASDPGGIVGEEGDRRRIERAEIGPDSPGESEASKDQSQQR